jgi:hypothetical protein
MSQIDGNLWLQFIARGTLDNGSSTAAQFPVSSQKPCYDFKRMFQNQLYFSNFAISFIGYFSKAIYNSFKLIGLYPNCHIAYLFKHRRGLFNNNYILL